MLDLRSEDRPVPLHEIIKAKMQETDHFLRRIRIQKTHGHTIHLGVVVLL